MIKVLFCCHGSTPGSRELAALVGQSGANHGIWNGGVLWFYFLKMPAAVLQKGISPKASLCSQNSRVSRRASHTGSRERSAR